MPEFPACAPETELAQDAYAAIPGRSEQELGGRELPQLDFCADWNPEFRNNGHHCCAKFIRGRRRSKKLNRCDPSRIKASYCGEMTAEQKEYLEAVASGKIPDVLTEINQSMGRRGEQAYCTVNNGFLAFGRRIIPSIHNRVKLRSPQRCVDFGTDSMIGMIEWVGRQVGKEYSKPEYAGVRLIVGDIAAPRGGCLSGRSGRRGHASHTSGQDADIGFLHVFKGKESPADFDKKLDASANWWFLKQIFKNPYACVKVIFLDRKHIRSLEKAARGDADWARYHRFIRHIPGHKNHFHVRVGVGPGQPGCVADARPELEPEEEVDEFEYSEKIDSLLNSIKSGQASDQDVEEEDSSTGEGSDIED